MSVHRAAKWLIEWTPLYVRATDASSGESVTGACLAELRPVLSRYREAIVGIGRPLVFLKTQRLPRAEPEDLRRILEAQLGQIFALPASQLTFDFVQTNDQTVEGMLTLIAAVRTDDLKQLKQELQQVGLKAERILPVALGAPVVTAHHGQPDALLLESAPGGISLDVVQGGVLRLSRTVPASSDLCAEARRTLLAARAEEIPWLAGPGVEASPARPVAGGALASLLEAPSFHFEMAEERLQALRRRAAARTRQAVLMLAAALLLVTFVVVDRSDSAAVVQKGEASWSRQLTKLRTVRDGLVARAQRSGAINATLQRAFQPGQTLSDVVWLLGDSLPEGAWLTGVTAERGKPLQIRGTAKTPADVASFVSALGASPRLRDVNLLFANSARVDSQPIVQFSISAFAVGNLPMPEPPKKTSKAKKKTAPAGGQTAPGSGQAASGGDAALEGTR